MASMLFGKDVGRMTTLAKKWGNIPRGLLRYISEEDGNIEHWYRAGANTAIQNCSTILAGGVLLDLPLLSSFYFIQPMKTDTGSICHRLPTISVPTPTLHHFLAEALQVQTNTTKLQFYNALSQYGQTRKAAGCIYENWFHCFFSAGREIRCHWIQCSSDNDTLGLPTVLQGSQTLVPSTKSWTPPYYWITSTTFPGIDSVLVLKEKIFVFQITISTDLKSPIKGLQKLQECLPPTLKKVPLSIVFVGAEEEQIKYLAEYWILYLLKGDIHISIAWSVVDPVQDGITYKVCNLLILQESSDLLVRYIMRLRGSKGD
ncbi:hypothetical protein J3R82DRAFT_11790 [Butyriboletus roseoflavus]|nr:hypothetical protein J3R82DRAFT_11790 [Butyriboletus roseoflavus]